MRNITIFFALVLLASCSKESVHNRNASRVDFFADERDALCKIQRYASGFGKKETVDKILSVSYIDSDKKSYAFVFYNSDRGPGNMVIEQGYTGDSNLVAYSKSIKCESDWCACKVRSIIDDNGQITLDCSCSTCTMLIH